jgi:hypothetical protein
MLRIWKRSEKGEKEKENKSDKIALPIGGEHIKISVDPIFC